MGGRPRRPDLDLPPETRRHLLGRLAVRRISGEVLPGPHHGRRLDQRPEGPVRADPERRGRRSGDHPHPPVAADGDPALCPGLGRRGNGLAQERRDQRRHAGRHRPVQAAELAARQPADPDPPRRLLGSDAPSEHRRLPLHQRPDRRLRRRQRRRRGRLPQLSRARECRPVPTRPALPRRRRRLRGQGHPGHQQHQGAVQRRAGAPRPVLRHRPRRPDPGRHVRLRPAHRQPLFASGAGLCRPDRPLSARSRQGARPVGRGGLSQRHRRDASPAAATLRPTQRRGADLATGPGGHPRQDREP